MLFILFQTKLRSVFKNNNKKTDRIFVPDIFSKNYFSIRTSNSLDPDQDPNQFFPKEYYFSIRTSNSLDPDLNQPIKQKLSADDTK